MASDNVRKLYAVSPVAHDNATVADELVRVAEMIREGELGDIHFGIVCVWSNEDGPSSHPFGAGHSRMEAIGVLECVKQSIHNTIYQED